MTKPSIILSAMLLSFMAVPALANTPEQQQALAVQQAIQAAQDDLAEQDLMNTNQESLMVAVARIVNLRMRTHFYAGACIRNYSTLCPVGWVELRGAKCGPPGDYQGSCRQFPVTPISSVEAKMQAAIKCGVEWPCQTCRLNFKKCPVGWHAVNGLVCKAPRTYDGMCDKVIDFADTSDETRARWAARCDAKWPCLDL